GIGWGVGAAAHLVARPAAAPAPPVSPAPTPVPTPAAAAPGAPAAAAPKEKIIGIRVIGYQTVSPDTIGHYLGIKVGDDYDPEKIRENFQTLWDVGLLEDVSFEAERTAPGVPLVV